MPVKQVAGVRLHYVEQGSGGEPIVFIHGFVSSHRWWLPTLERLSSAYHAYAVDLRGAGESGRPQGDYTIAQHAADLAGLIDALDLDRFVLVGHSMGGAVSMQYALEHQERLKALILVDPLAPFGMQLLPDVYAWVDAQQGKGDGLRLIVSGAFATPPSGAYFEQLVADALGWDAAAYHGAMADMARFSITDKLTDLRVPTIVTWGDKDTVIPFPGIAEVFSHVPGCSLEVWHGVGHSGPIEIPDRFVQVLTRFIGEVGHSS